jgi:hypothetical protein
VWFGCGYFIIPNTLLINSFEYFKNIISYPQSNRRYLARYPQLSLNYISIGV